MDIYYNAAAAAAPVAVLIVLMVKRSPWPSYKALPLAAVMMYLLKLAFFKGEPNMVNATVAEGLLNAVTPVMIVWGAIMLFRVMEDSGCMDIVRGWLNRITGNPVGQLMIIGWAFSFMIEGASGFGTPPALAAPLLVGMGFDPLKTAIFCLVMNSVPVSFGAVGTPTWFGLGNLGLSAADIDAIGWKSALMHSAAALVIPVIALRFVVDWGTIRRNLVYIYLSILGCVVPYFLIALYSYEFPSLLGGGLGFGISVLLARHNFGLEAAPAAAAAATSSPSRGGWAVFKALFPLWGSVLVLILTRLQSLGLKALLASSEEFAGFALGTIGKAEISRALVLQLKNIFGTEICWRCQLLYIPAILPFFIVSLLTILFFRMGAGKGWNAVRSSVAAVRYPVISLAGALVLVALLLNGGDEAPAKIIGRALGALTGRGWFYIAAYLGSLGSFFSGSNTVSNLTFGGIQLAAAQALNFSPTTILALQSVGGACGSMVCIHSIVAVGSVLGLTTVAGYEGGVIKRTFWPVVLYGGIAAAVALFL